MKVHLLEWFFGKSDLVVCDHAKNETAKVILQVHFSAHDPPVKVHTKHPTGGSHGETHFEFCSHQHQHRLAHEENSEPLKTHSWGWNSEHQATFSHWP